MSQKLENLRGFVCLVTGASRGMGRGIAIGLGECGATVYITARTVKPKPDAVGGDVGSLEETAAEINARGGVAIPVAVDHSDDSQVINLFARIRREQKGRLDILVNNVFDGVDSVNSSAFANRKYWELAIDESPVTFWDQVNRVGLRNHYICSVLGSRLMLAYRDELKEKTEDSTLEAKSPDSQRPGLIFNISSYGGLRYLFCVPYGVGKAAIDRMTCDMATELKSKKKSISVMSIWPGMARTEKLLSRAEKFEEKLYLDFATYSESPELSGRVIAKIAMETREELLNRSGRAFIVADEANRMGISDIDGRSPITFRSLKYLLIHAGWKRLAAFIPSFLNVPYFLLKPASPQF